MASTVSILVSNIDDTTSDPKSADYFWPPPKIPDDFRIFDNRQDVLPDDADKGGAEDKEDGAPDTHIEQYPDKPITAEATDATQSSRCMWIIKYVSTSALVVTFTCACNCQCVVRYVCT